MVSLDYQVAASADDGFCTSAGTGYDNAGTLFRVGYFNSNIFWIFHRFVGVTIPTSAQITSAYLSMHFTYGSSVNTIYAEDNSNPSAVSSGSNFLSRIRSTNSLPYSPSSTGWVDSGDISPIIQELVNSYDYSSGSALQIFVIGSDSGGDGDADTYDVSGNVSGAKLHIEYTLPSTSHPKIRCIA